MSPDAFQPWRDYFQLAKLVEGMQRPDGGPAEEEAAGAQPRQRQLQRQQQQQPPPLVDASPPAARGRREEAPRSSSGGGGGCSFCKQNGESRSFYASHRLKDEAGRVQCPILRKYTCPQCGASDDLAHTRRFCPLTKEGYVSVYTGFARNSAGKRRKKI